MAWIAALAILLGALAPTVSRWLSTASPLNLALLEVCTTRTGGPSTIVLKSTGEQPADHATLDHCPLCLVHSDDAGLPPPAHAVALITGLTDAPPALFLQGHSPLPVWAAALARAPPSQLT